MATEKILFVHHSRHPIAKNVVEVAGLQAAPSKVQADENKINSAREFFLESLGCHEHLLRQADVKTDSRHSFIISVFPLQNVSGTLKLYCFQRRVGALVEAAQPKKQHGF